MRIIPECATTPPVHTAVSGDRDRKKFVLATQHDGSRFGESSNAACLTKQIFRGISSRACGPCRTAPAAAEPLLSSKQQASGRGSCAAPRRRVTKCGAPRRLSVAAHWHRNCRILRPGRCALIETPTLRGEHVSVTGTVKFFNETKGCVSCATVPRRTAKSAIAGTTKAVPRSRRWRKSSISTRPQWRRCGPQWPRWNYRDRSSQRWLRSDLPASCSSGGSSKRR